MALAPAIPLTIVLFFIFGCIIHWFAWAVRGWTHTRPQQQQIVVVTRNKVTTYDLIQRLFHWIDFVVLGIMALTGVSIFLSLSDITILPAGPVDAIISLLGISSTSAKIATHTTFGWALLALIVIHIVWDTAVVRGWADIWFGRADIVDARKRARIFLGRAREYPREGKYDFFMKSYHWTLSISIVALGITGIYFWDPLPWLIPMPFVDYATMQLLLMTHDFFASLLIGLAIQHIYFATIPHNWPILKGMVTGAISKDFYLEHFDAARWPPTRPVEVRRSKSANQ